MGRIPPNLLLYPEFFDDKRALLKGGWRPYVRALIRHRQKIRMALYPDYATAALTMSVPRNIEYVVPVHDLSAFEVVDRLLSDNYIAWAGYASDPKYRNYTMDGFLSAADGRGIWYLGASTMHELREAILNNFGGVDVTGYILGNNNTRRDARLAAAKVREIALRTASVEGRQIRLMEVSV
jgi:hypothetical protein